MNRDSAIFLALLLLTAATFLTIPKVDYAQAEVLFYLKSLPILYYISTVGTFIFAILGKNKALGLSSVILFGLLTHYTPYVLYVQPWFPDVYFYLSEALNVKLYGFSGVVGHTDVSPGLSFMSGPFLIATNIDPFVFVRVFQVLSIVIIGFLLYAIARKLDLFNPNIAPLVFFSITWQDEISLSRMTYSLIFLLALVLFAVRNPSKIDQDCSRTNFALSFLLIFMIVIAHPGVPLFLIADFLAAILLLKLFIRKSGSYMKELAIKTSFLAVAWMAWNLSRKSMGAIDTLTDLTRTIGESLMGSSSSIETSVAKLASVSYTPEYYVIIQAHLVHMVIVFLLFLSIFFLFRLRRSASGLLLASGFLASLLVSVPLFFAGLPWFSRPSFLMYTFFAPLAAMAIDQHLVRGKARRSHPSTKSREIFGILLIVAIFVSAISLPLIKYSDTPFLYLPTKEHGALKFAVKSLPTNLTLLSTSYNTPWGFYSMLLNSSGGLGSSITYSDWRLLVGTEQVHEVAVLTLNSILARDAFFTASPTYGDMLTNLTSSLSAIDHKIYDAGGNDSIFVPNSR